MQSQADIRASITNRIIVALKKGTIPWRKPWSGIDGPRLPTNFVTGRPYSGLNVPLLWLAGQERGYPYDFWGTYRQLRSVGAQVRKGEKGVTALLWKPITKLVKKPNGEEKEETWPMVRTFTLFNVAQAEGEAVEQFHEKPTLVKLDHSNREEFDRAVAATGADIRFGGEKAAYSRPPLDYIRMPHEGRFESFPAYAETLLHELAHWSEVRLNWAGTYGEGELRAEIGSCFMSAALAIPDSGDLSNHASYVASWLQALENDPKFIFRASSAGSKAADYILSFSKPQDGAGSDDEIEPVAVAG